MFLFNCVYKYSFKYFSQLWDKNKLNWIELKKSIFSRPKRYHEILCPYQRSVTISTYVLSNYKQSINKPVGNYTFRIVANQFGKPPVSRELGGIKSYFLRYQCFWVKYHPSTDKPARYHTNRLATWRRFKLAACLFDTGPFESAMLILGPENIVTEGIMNCYGLDLLILACLQTCGQITLGNTITGSIVTRLLMSRDVMIEHPNPRPRRDLVLVETETLIET